MAEKLEQTCFGEDDNSATMSIHPGIFSLEVAQLAAYSLGDRAHVVFTGDPDREIRVAIRAKAGEHIRAVVDSYHEELLSYAVHETVNARNHEIIELILRRVLATNKPLAEDPSRPAATPLGRKTRW